MTSPTSAPTRTIRTVVLIVDIVRSTALYEELGNVQARELVCACLKTLGEIVAAHGGLVIKSMGDGLLCQFPSAEEAVKVAIAMCDRAPEYNLEVRVGLHHGEVIEDGGDIFGDAVNTASRVADVANPSEILVTHDLREALPAFMRGLLRHVQPVSVKGKREPLDLFAVPRDSSSGTLVVASRAVVPADEGTLELTYRGTSVRLDQTGGAITIGREPDNDLVVESDWTSRRHVRIYHKMGKFVLVDQSANGTYVVFDGQAKLYLHREETLLLKAGRIHLGDDPDGQAGEPVHFQLGD